MQLTPQLQVLDSGSVCEPQFSAAFGGGRAALGEERREYSVNMVYAVYFFYQDEIDKQQEK